MPIVLADGRFFGTLCAIDPRPARVETPETIGMFKLFAELIAFHLDAIERVASSEASLLDERKTSELREQFIAVLGHDLRNPLTAILSSAEMLQRSPPDDRTARFSRIIQASAERISGMINNLLDFARGRLGGGVPIVRQPEALGALLAEVVSEFRAGQPDRVIDAVFSLPVPVICDPGRIAQLFSNLLANALAYGNTDEPIRVRAEIVDGTFELWVANAGDPIPPTAQAELFQPFYRTEAQSGGGGLGLGLYIASEIAKAHGGSLTVASSPDETRFTFRMPAGA